SALTLGQRRMQDVALQLRAGLRQVGLRLAQRLDIDRRAIERRAARPGQEGAVVVGIVPGKAAFVMCLVPEGGHEFHGFDRRRAVERDRLAVGLDLLAAPGPKVRINECGGVAEGMTERLPDRAILCFKLLAGLAVLLPGLRKLAVTVA